MVMQEQEASVSEIEMEIYKAGTVELGFGIDLNESDMRTLELDMKVLELDMKVLELDMKVLESDNQMRMSVQEIQEQGMDQNSNLVDLMSSCYVDCNAGTDYILIKLTLP